MVNLLQLVCKICQGLESNINKRGSLLLWNQHKCVHNTQYVTNTSKQYVQNKHRKALYDLSRELCTLWPKTQECLGRFDGWFPLVHENNLKFA